MNYLEKYLKYKIKYLNLKVKLGGAQSSNVDAKQTNKKFITKADINEFEITKADLINFENWKNKIPNLLTLKEGEYPEQVVAYKFIEPDMNVLELGANIGRNTQIIANIVKKGRLLAVEMNENNKVHLDEIAKFNNNTSVFIGAISEKPLYFDGSSWTASEHKNIVPINTISISQAKEDYFKWNVIVADCEGCIVELCNNPNFVENVKMIIIENDFKCKKDRQNFEEAMKRHNFQEKFTVSKGDLIIPGVPDQSWSDGDKTQNAFISVWKKSM